MMNATIARADEIESNNYINVCESWMKNVIDVAIVSLRGSTIAEEVYSVFRHFLFLLVEELLNNKNQTFGKNFDTRQ